MPRSVPLRVRILNRESRVSDQHRTKLHAHEFVPWCTALVLSKEWPGAAIAGFEVRGIIILSGIRDRNFERSGCLTF